VAAASGPDERQALVSRLWKEHWDAAFPARLRGEELAGVDMVMVDADIAGCVDSWLSSSGPLDPERLSLLRYLRRDLDRVLALLDDDGERQYYERLRDLAQLVSDAGAESGGRVRPSDS
jgi:hypothetical protein